MDKKIVLELYNFTLRHMMVRRCVKLIVSASAWLFFIFFAAEAAILMLTGDFRALPFCVVPFITIVFNMFLRKLVGRKRPFDAIGFKSVVGHKSVGSFPSNHSASAMVIAFAFLYLSVFFGVIMAALAVITGFSRVLAGLHYLSDVLVGLFVGAFFGYIGFFLLF